MVSDTSTTLSTRVAEERKEQALEAAEACIQLLKERFGARRVILFGSIAGQGPWHGRSDIDLAVEGLTPEEFFPAYSACCDLLPRGLELDLVPLEDAYPEMRARILGEAEMPNDPLLALQGLIEDELVALNRVVESTEEALASLSDDPSQFELHGLAA
jgi:predicted nucleotidyltransferase